MASAEPSNGAAAAAAPDDALRDLLPDEDDLLYEEELLRNPYSLKMWSRYLDARKGASPKKRYLLYERALNALPGSYKVPPPARPAALPPALLLRCPALLQHALLLLQRLHPRRADPCLCLPSRSPQPSPYTHPHPLNPHTPTRPRSSGMPT